MNSSKSTAAKSIPTSARKLSAHSSFPGTALIVSAILSARVSARAAEAAVPLQGGTTQIQKPKWLSELSLTVKETYDDNVFAAGADKKYFPASFTVVPGSVEADKGQCSLVTTV